GGRARTQIIEKAEGKVLMPFIRENVQEESHVYTDEWPAYWAVKYNSFYHGTVNHRQKEYVRGEVHTNTIEGYWSLVKGGLKGVYRNVSPKYLQTYFNEYSFRYNRRNDNKPMFLSFLHQVEKASN
ncbi:MAG TPA: IS1595 family transposase, partial [Pyrinomonadaceae bacterium]|nr:IS1595 family transposase [Pyrinomonadaceae bacterium]